MDETKATALGKHVAPLPTAMRILLVTHVYPPSVGGTEAIVSSLAGLLKQRGHSVMVCSPSTTPSQELHESRDGVSVIRYWRRRWQLAPIMIDQIVNRACAAAGFAAGLVTFFFILLLYRPTIVHMHLPVFAEFFFIHHLRAIFRFRLVVSFHGGEMIDCEPGRPSTRLRRLSSLLAAANAITAVSERLAEHLAKLDARRGCRWNIVPNGVRTLTHTGTRFYHGRPFILGVGRLETIKGFDLLIAAFHRASLPLFDLVIAGDGGEGSALRDLAQQLGISQRVFFLGQCDMAKVQATMEACHFIVVPSRAEGFGLVALEAMALGKPVVATSVGGLPDLVPSPPNKRALPTIDSLSHSIRDMASVISDPIATLAISGVNRAKAELYSLDRMVTLYERTYREHDGQN